MNFDEILEKFKLLQYNVDCGEDIINRFRRGEIKTKDFCDLDNDSFCSLVLDMHISDKNLSEMFRASEYQIRKKRNELKLPRGRKLIEQWYESNREPVDIDAIIANIAHI